MLLPSSLLLLNAEASETRDAECRRVPKEMVEACVGADAASIQYLPSALLSVTSEKRRDADGAGESRRLVPTGTVLACSRLCCSACETFLAISVARSGSRQMLSPLLQPGVDSIGEAGGSNLVKKVP